MSGSFLVQFLADRSAPFVLILGTNELASAIAARLKREGYRVVMSHDPFPPVIRRGMAFYDTLFEDQVDIDGMRGQRAGTVLEIAKALADKSAIPVTALQFSDLLPLRAPDILIDARIQKRCVTPILRKIVALSIGLGPNFVAGVNCDIAIETHPDHAGELLEAGATQPADGVPRFLGGIGRERFIYSARSGIWRTPLDIGSRIFKGYVIGRLDGLPVSAPMDGRLRGLARDGLAMPSGVKLVEIDPRGSAARWTGSDETEATLRAIYIGIVSLQPAPMTITAH